MERKLNLRHLLLFCGLFISASAVHAQNKANELPETGFYVLVNNKDSMRVTIVQFYNDEKQLIYEEKVQGRKLKLNNKKVRESLNSCLNKALLAWNYKKEVLLDKKWVAATVH
ncbi:hypothetical protein [Mucilaginibacter aquaedulcis]|uniref:hypothetical protein n=1 Tax=Mucilaginibacter aquaedulcis TaxID=1187081 RepID=UPI0025B304F2|nr:hypothetical protein [Mucilaginibacter aquaedulcis]MDN3549850.1 hypothetical protein [Mucilaginibacter aquaedulcis]